MARILIGNFGAIGHVLPFLPLARALMARGHEVFWTTDRIHRERIEATGARYLAPRHSLEFSGPSENFAKRGKELKGAAALKFDLKHVFINNAPNQMRDIDALVQETGADMLLFDPGFVGGAWYVEKSGMPAAVMNILPMGLSSRDAAPMGLGMQPSATPLGRLRNRGLNWAIEHVLFRDVMQHWNAVRAQQGLPATGWLMDISASMQLYMQPSVPGFEYPRSDLPQNVHFIGMMPAEAPRAWDMPSWWHELDGSRPVVHVTQGTVANERPELIAPTVEGLAGEDVLVVVSTGGRAPAELGLDNVPANVRISTFLSYPELLPRTAAMITNGGYGGTQMALSYGVPLAVGGVTEDKPEVSARVAWSGAGINFKTATPTPAQVRSAVRQLLDEPRFRQRAQALKAEYARYDAVANGVELIERLALTGRPVLRAVDQAPSAPMFTPAVSR